MISLQLIQIYIVGFIGTLTTVELTSKPPLTSVPFWTTLMKKTANS